MSPINNENLEKQLGWRYATKRFDPTKKLSEHDWSTLQKALVLSPSSFGLQPWRFIVVSDPKTREALRVHSWNQPQVVEASHFVVMAAKSRVIAEDVDAHLRRLAELQRIPEANLGGLREMILGFTERQDLNQEEWATRQVYIALGVLLTSAALLGIDACPMEGIDPAGYDEILGLREQGLRTKVACALGYRSAEDRNATAPKVRFAAGDLFIQR